MKIVTLIAENVKRLHAIEIVPDSTVQIIGGRNAQGKSSVLDSIWLALGGGAAARATARPIRDGETDARVVLDLGDYVVTRTWTGDKTTLTVTSPEGRKLASPQKLLDGLIGSLAFDPFAFTTLSAREQRDQLLSLVTLPFDPIALDRKRSVIFDERTEVGRRAKDLGAIPAFDPFAPDAEVSSAAVLAELRAAQDAARASEATYQRTARAQIAREQAAEALKAAVAEEEAALAAFKAMPEVPDVAAIEQRLATVDETNRAVRAKIYALAKKTRLAALDAEHAALSDQLAVLDQEKAAGLAAAVFPVDGLAFDSDGVTYRGLPFSEASRAEKIRVSLGMAMALNPTLRVIRILDGSLLDDENLALITEMAGAQDYQVWVERVGDADSTAVIIEDGQVRA